MTPSVTLDEVATLAEQLAPADRLRLVERIVHQLVTLPPATEPTPKRSWRELRGAMAYPMCGEDAQAWVSRERREGDEQREEQGRRST